MNPASACVRRGGQWLPVNTLVVFEFTTELSSKTSTIDDFFPIRLTRPIMIEGREVIPAGTTGMGQIVHAAKSGWGGKAGELIVAARYLDYGGVHIPLRRLRMGEPSVGDDRVGEAVAASMIISPVLGFFINGGEKTVLVGTHANAIVSAETEIPVAARPAAPEATTSN